jgi:homoserine kinase
MLSKEKKTACAAENIMKDVYNKLGLDYHTYVTTISNEGCVVI